MNKPVFRLFLCCTLIAALTALLLLGFNFFCFCALGSDYYASPERDAVHILTEIETALGNPGSPVPSLPDGQWCILIGESGDVIWQQNMPADIPIHYSINDVARFTRWFISDYPVYVRTTEQGLLVLGLPKNAVGKYDLSYSNRWFETLPLRLVGLAAINLLLALGLAAGGGQPARNRRRRPDGPGHQPVQRSPGAEKCSSGPAGGGPTELDQRHFPRYPYPAGCDYGQGRGHSVQRCPGPLPGGGGGDY